MTGDTSEAADLLEDTWVIIPVHNRQEMTLTCLDHLKSEQNWDQLNVVVVDDGSTDGTGEAIEASYPSVHLLHGDGDLWWGGAMSKGMRYALERDARVVIWLNDDVLPEPGALDALATKVAAVGDIVLGSVVTPETGHGYTTRWRSSWLGPEPLDYDLDRDVQPCDFVSGKMVGVAREVVDVVGVPGTRGFHHHYADFEYTYRATEAGFDVGVYTQARARDMAYTFEHSGLSSEVTLLEAVKGSFDPKSGYSIIMKYQRDKELGRAPAPILMTYNLVKGLGTIGLKIGLCLFRREQRFV